MPDNRLVAAALALATACLYAYGLSYHRGYLSAWGLEEGLFPLSFDRTVFQGFVASSELGAVTLLPLLVVALMLLLAALLGAWLASAWRAWQARRATPSLRPDEAQTGSGLDRRAVALMARAGLWIYAATVVYAIIMGLVWSADQLGRAAAARQARALPTQAELAVRTRGGEARPARIVLCSASQCALWIEGRLQVQPTAEITRLDYPAGSTSGMR